MQINLKWENWMFVTLTGVKSEKSSSRALSTTDFASSQVGWLNLKYLYLKIN